MIIWQANGGTVLDNLSKVFSKFQPGCVMTFMVVNLVTGKKQDVRVNSLDIVDNVLPRNVTAVGRSNRIAGEPCDNDLILVLGVFTNGPRIHRLITMPNPILPSFGIIPRLNTKRCGPTFFDHFSSGDFDPITVFLNFQSGNPRICVV